METGKCELFAWLDFTNDCDGEDGGRCRSYAFEDEPSLTTLGNKYATFSCCGRDEEDYYYGENEYEEGEDEICIANLDVYNRRFPANRLNCASLFDREAKTVQKIDCARNFVGAVGERCDGEDDSSTALLAVFHTRRSSFRSYFHECGAIPSKTCSFCEAALFGEATTGRSDDALSFARIFGEDDNEGEINCGLFCSAALKV